MSNYQLYRSNVFLGGQMKYDLIVSKTDKGLKITDFHITPVSKSVPFNRFIEENLLHYSHLENISAYYNHIKGNFYNPCNPSEYANPWPTLDDVTPINTEWFMGCKRIPYKIYHKQFGFFCPLWLTEVNGPITFEISLYDKEVMISKTNLELNFKDDADDYHSKFCNYLKNHINNVEINSITGHEIMNVNLTSRDAWVAGIDVSTGLYRKIDITNDINLLMSRERPFTEFNSILSNQFPNNHLIAKQLFNFNICFNPEDILSQSIINDMMGKSFSFKIKVYMDDKKSQELPLRDFYTNYTYIPRKKIKDYTVTDILNPQEDTDMGLNVLSYMKEPSNINLIDKNKLSQQTCMWSLQNNNDYIFNSYDGFSGYKDK